jgi:hypothetical protein
MRNRPLNILIIALCFFFFQTGELRCATYEADYVPWSGYWWPFSAGGLVTGSDYNGHPAPLEKYDYVTSGTCNGPATAYGLKHYYDSNALSWEGMCFYWAAAAILEEEPVHKGIYEETTFLVGDKKGLLTVAYDGTLYNRYYFNNPEDFHEVLEDFIRTQKTPIIMDLGTNGEIWNYPVFKYDMDYTQAANVRHYTTRIYYANDGVHPDYVGTFVSRSTYYYYFVLDAEGNITESGWEGGTINGPPKNASEPFGTEPRNTGIDYEQVMRIVTTNDDRYEENDSFEGAALISSGAYSLLAADSDYFKVELEMGDKLNIQVVAEGEEDISLRTYNPERVFMKETPGRGEQVIEADKTGEYFLEIVPLEPSEDPAYKLFLLQSLACQGIFPLNPTGVWQTGIALLNPDNSMGRAIISLLDRDGLPQSGYSASTSAHYLLGMIEEDFGLSHSDKGYIRVDSDVRLWGLEAVTDGNYLMLGANLIPADTASAELFFPHFARTDGWQTSFGLINIGEQTEEILRKSYDQEGRLLAWDTIELGPGQMVENNTLYLYGVLTSDARSMSASIVSGRESLIGYIKFLNPSSASKGRALVPLAMERETEFVVPHIASGGYWWTGIAVMNTGNDDSIVTFSAYDMEGNQIGAAEHFMKAKQNLVQEASNIFPGLQAGEIASMRIVSQNAQSLSGFLVYGSTDGLQLAGLPIHPAFASPVYLSHVACSGSWWTGIGLMNTSDVPADISFSLFNVDGNLLDLKIRHLNPNQRLASTIKGLFGNDISQAARYLKIESDSGHPVSGIYLIGSSDGLRLMGDVIR